MQDCHSIVENIYTHPDILNLISKIQPESIRDDLRQEIAVSLLEQPCEKTVNLFAQDNLLRYAIKVVWNMATGTSNDFYRKYRRSDFKQAVEYIRIMQQGCTILPSNVFKAKNILENPQSMQQDHEARIFNKYIELGSSRSVAAYYGIPINHVCNVVAKVRKELKQVINQ